MVLDTNVLAYLYLSGDLMAVAGALFERDPKGPLPSFGASGVARPMTLS